jgi:maltose/moltooligosaccharide transporter
MEGRTISPIRLVVFSFGLFAMQTTWGFCGATLPLYLMTLTDSETVAGVVLALAGLFGVLMPVFAGSLSDRVRWRLGRRKPFIAAGWAVVVSVLLVLPRITSLWAALPLILLFYAGFFVTVAPYFALLADIAPADRRGRAAGLMYLIGGIGIVLFLLFGAPLWDTDPRLPFLWAAGAIVLSVTIMLAGTREGGPAAGVPARLDIIPFLVSHRRVSTFYGAMILWWSGTWMVNFFFVIAARALFSISTKEAITGLFCSTFAYVVCALPLGILGDRIGHKRVTAGGLALYCLMLFSVPLIGGVGTVYLCMALAGAGFSVLLSAAYAFFLRIIPEDKTAGLLGIYMGCQNGSLLVGNALGGTLIEHGGPAFLFFGAGALVVLSLVTFLLVPGEVD